jgi:hypothetical protein
MEGNVKLIALYKRGQEDLSSYQFENAALQDERDDLINMVHQLKEENSKKWRVEERDDWRDLVASLQNDRRELQASVDQLQSENAELTVQLQGGGRRGSGGGSGGAGGTPRARRDVVEMEKLRKELGKIGSSNKRRRRMKERLEEGWCCCCCCSLSLMLEGVVFMTEHLYSLLLIGANKENHANNFHFFHHSFSLSHFHSTQIEPRWRGYGERTSFSSSARIFLLLLRRTLEGEEACRSDI